MTEMAYVPTMFDKNSSDSSWDISPKGISVIYFGAT